LTLTVTDKDGGTGQSFYETVVVFNPKVAVLAAGWIKSPAGAYVPSPTKSGRANFAFAAAYPRGAHTPTGLTVFEFTAGRFVFRSTGNDWLLVNGSNIQLSGSGKVNGSGQYKFLVTAVDGHPDAFRIKIWSAADGTVVYDNGSLLGISGGTIVIVK
jgi:hypothetical protein